VWDMAAIRYDHPFGTGYVARGLLGESCEVAEPGSIFGLGVLAEWDDVILCPDDQQGGRGDQVVLMPDGLLVDHLEGECRSSSPPRVVRAQCDTHQDVGQRLVHLGVGVDEVPSDIGVNNGRSVQLTSCWYRVSSDCGGMPVR
jgi:hypothetical protein